MLAVGAISCQGSDPGSEGTDDHPTPEQELMMAIGIEDTDAIRYLIRSGVAVNSRDTASSTTPLMIANTGEVAEVLLALGADPALTDREGATALHHAIFAQDVLALVPLLVRHGAPVDAVAEGWSSETPLLSARQLFIEGEPEIATQVLRLLAAHGADVNAADDLGYTLLHTAAVNDKPALARLALELGVDPEKRSRDGTKALEYARETDHTDIMAILE